jgi:hypothetical protein
MADLLIAAAMLFYVNMCLFSSGHWKLSALAFDFPQLQRRRERDCYNGDHVLRRVVRLTIETNVMTGKYHLYACAPIKLSSHASSHRGNRFTYIDCSISCECFKTTGSSELIAC